MGVDEVDTKHLFERIIMQNKFIGMIFVCIVMLQSHSVSAFTTQTFLGITLGKPLVVDNCDSPLHDKICANKINTSTFKYTTCWEGRSVDIFLPQALEIMSILKDGKIGVLVSDGDMVEGFSFATSGYDVQYKALKLLTKKYGKPTYVKKKMLRNTFNTNYQALNAEWKFSDIVVNLKGIDSDNLEYGRVTIYTKAFKKFLDNKKKEEKANKVKM